MRRLRFLPFFLIGCCFFTASFSAVHAQNYEKLWQFECGATPYAGLVQGGDGNFYGTTYAGGNHGMGSVFKLTPAGVISTLVSFNGANGSGLYNPLVVGQDGSFYGTTYGGGAYAKGAVFKVTYQGAFTTLVSFNDSNGANPYTGLTLGSDGSLYGTTTSGDYPNGTIFKITPQGALTTLHRFEDYAGGTSPQSALCLHPDGNFYGTTNDGGSGGAGTLFKMTPSGTLTTLLNFNGPNGKSPAGKLTLGADGALYGSTINGGASTGDGFLFKITAAGAQTALASFNGLNGSSPTGGPVLHSNGNFYGTTLSGGNNFLGTLYRITSTGNLATLLQFSRTTGSYPRGGLLLASDGNFYGALSDGTTGGCGGIFKLTPGGAFTNFASFSGHTSGGGPLTQVTGTEGLGSKLILGSDDNFYGTTYLGGANNQGTVFKLTPAGALTTLASFSAASTGAYPVGAMVQGDDGAFYGTTTQAATVGNNVSVGTVFRVTAAGALTKIASFRGNNGKTACGGLVRGADGALYGTTFNGDPSEDASVNGAGSIFKVSLAGALTPLVQFNGANGLHPYAGLTLGRDGNFYGSTTGNPNFPSTLFKMTPAGELTTLYTFGGATGDKPCGALVETSSGVFYGTTYAGGAAPGGGGTIFRVTSTGQFSNVFNFDSAASANGCNPHAELTLGPDGNLYSVASRGGASDSGTLFKITPGGALTTLFSFDGASQGYCPVQAPTFGPDGKLYGTANSVIYRFNLNAPITVTGAASAVGMTSATVQGTANTHGLSGTAFFQYWGPTGMIEASGTVNLPASTADASVSLPLSNLMPGGKLYGYRLVVTTSSGQVKGADNTFTTLTLLQNWRQGYFGVSDNAGAAADSADPDGDGVPNLMEYALGMDPTKASVAALPKVSRQGVYLYLTAAKNPAATDVTYSAESSNDLVNWRSDSVTIVTNDAKTFQALDNWPASPANPRRFMRLRVTSP